MFHPPLALLLLWSGIAFAAHEPSRPSRPSLPGSACRTSLMPDANAGDDRALTPVELMWYMHKPLAVRYETESGALITVQGTLMGVSNEHGEWKVHLAILGRSDRMRIIPHELIRAVMRGNWAEERISVTSMPALDRESAVPLTRPKAEVFVARAAERDAINAAAILRNDAQIHQIMPLLAGEEAASALTTIYLEHMRGFIPEMPEELYGANNPDSVANLIEFRKNPLRFMLPTYLINGAVITGDALATLRLVLAGTIVPPSPEHIEEVFNAFCSALDMLTQDAAEKIRKAQRRGYVRPEDARHVYTLAAWAQRMTTLIQAGMDANTRAGRSLFDWTIQRVGLLAGGVTIPRIDITQKSISERLIEERSSGDLSDIVRQFSPFIPYSKDGDLKYNLSEHYHQEIEEFVRVNAGREAPHILVRHVGHSTPSGYPHGTGMSIVDYGLSSSDERRTGSWLTVRNFYLHLIDEAVRNPLHIPRDPPSRAVGTFVVDFLTKRPSRSSMGE